MFSPSPPSGTGGLGFLGGRPRGLLGAGSPSCSVLGCFGKSGTSIRVLDTLHADMDLWLAEPEVCFFYEELSSLWVDVRAYVERQVWTGMSQ